VAKLLVKGPSDASDESGVQQVSVEKRESGGNWEVKQNEKCGFL